ncbi:hypothetical protein RJ640_019602 [Escallonia rubra]|uniref:Fe2OG dioxygenase domain-containing protein n=1 Tax=Escallonia rubra TaxID=112253 RepID=A0AA88UQE9_9ASTE|nr:hypothetical protein RJ640_019602 [Escallonia rubra]
MLELVSSWSNVHSLPEDYVFPTDKRPGEVIAPACKTIPVINLQDAIGNNRNDMIQQILNASQEYGFFQVINHGVSETLMDDTMKLFKEFFDMPDEDKASVYSEDPSKSCRLYTSSYNYANEKVHFWRDNLKHPCHPLEEWVHLWPERPIRYRDVVGTYSLEVRDLSMRILELICEGLGLQPGYFGDELSEQQLLSVNHYPPCPEPSLALGLPKHSDPNLITILLQGDVYGLQVFKDGQWIGVEPITNAIVVNIGHQLQIISNGKFKSAEHRAVTNLRDPRTTVVTFISPSYKSVVQPADALLDEFNPPIYTSFIFKDFLINYTANDGYTEAALEPYKIL